MRFFWRLSALVLALATTLPACAQKVAPTISRVLQPALRFQCRGCEGTCPDYLAAVYLDGRVEYEGRFYVPVLGKRTLHLPATEVAALLAEAQRIHFERFRERYLPPNTTFDPPGLGVTVQPPGQAAHSVSTETGQALPAPLQAFLAHLRRCLDPLAGLK